MGVILYCAVKSRPIRPMSLGLLDHPPSRHIVRYFGAAALLLHSRFWLVDVSCHGCLRLQATHSRGNRVNPIKRNPYHIKPFTAPSRLLLGLPSSFFLPCGLSRGLVIHGEINHVSVTPEVLSTPFKCDASATDHLLCVSAPMIAIHPTLLSFFWHM